MEHYFCPPSFKAWKTRVFLIPAGAIRPIFFPTPGRPFIVEGNDGKGQDMEVDRFRRDAETFRELKQARTAEARQVAALQLACGIDLSAALGADGAMRARIVLRIERALERERLRGARRHWSYDLNRHIALKQALDRVLRCDSAAKPGTAPSRSAQGETAPDGAVSLNSQR